MPFLLLFPSQINFMITDNYYTHIKLVLFIQHLKKRWHLNVISLIIFKHHFTKKKRTLSPSFCFISNVTLPIQRGLPGLASEAATPLLPSTSFGWLVSIGAPISSTIMTYLLALLVGDLSPSTRIQALWKQGTRQFFSSSSFPSVQQLTSRGEGSRNIWGMNEGGETWRKLLGSHS